MKSIEFVGPSGIGKTTFLRNLVKKRNNANWITNQEALNLIAKKKAKILERIIIKAAKKMRVNLSPDMAVQYKEKIKKLKKYDKECSILINLFYKDKSYSKAHAWRKILIHDYYTKEVIYNMLIISELKKESVIVFDEGIIHNGGVISISKNFKIYKEIYKSIIFPKGVIFFELNTDEYRRRLISRFDKKGKRSINALWENVSDEELEIYIKMAISKSRHKYEVCQKLNIPVLKIEPIASDENIQTALTFIDHFNN